MAMLNGQYIILLSLSVSVLTALKKYKGCHLERKNRKYINKLEIIVLAAALKKGLRVTTQQ